MAITQSKPGIFLSQPVLQSIPMNPTPCKTHWNSAGSFISDTQLGYITNVSAGCGLIRCAGNIVPFENSFPRNTRLYQLMTTKPDEALRGV